MSLAGYCFPHVRRGKLPTITHKRGRKIPRFYWGFLSCVPAADDCPAPSNVRALWPQASPPSRSNVTPGPLAWVPGRTSRRRRREDRHAVARRHDWPRANVTPLPSPGRSSRRRLVHLLDGAVKIGKRSPCVWPCRAARFGVVSRAASHLSAAWLAIGTAENEWRLGCADKYGASRCPCAPSPPMVRGVPCEGALPVGSMWRPAFTGRVQSLRAGQFFGIVRNNSKGVRPGLSAPGAA